MITIENFLFRENSQHSTYPQSKKYNVCLGKSSPYPSTYTNMLKFDNLISNPKAKIFEIINYDKSTSNEKEKFKLTSFEIYVEKYDA